MRVLHTSDWHLGALFHDQLRDADEQHALDQLVALCANEAVDAVLIAGDIFDTANPSADAQQRYYRTLMRIVQEAGVGTVVVIAGNHDNGLRLDGPRELMAALRLHVRGLFARDADPLECVVDLFDRAGKLAAVCAAVPYLREGDLRMPELQDSALDIARKQADALRARLSSVHDAARARAGSLPLLAMTHCFAAGGAISQDERPVYAQVGNLSQVQIDSLARTSSYTALGHLHRPQIVGGHEHWRYCGSLLPNGFDETSASRSVVIADIAAEGGPAQIRLHTLTSHRRYARLQGTPSQVSTQIAALPARESHEPEPWLQATVALDGPHPGIAAEISDACAERGWSALSIRQQRPVDVDISFRAEAEIGGLAEIEPESVFAKLHELTYGGAPDEPLSQSFRALLQEVREAG